MYLNGINTNYNKNGPAVYIHPETERKLAAYYRGIDEVHKGMEISGLGTVQEWEGDLLIHDVILFKQDVTGGDTEIEPAVLGDWLSEEMANGTDPELFRLWWHKHPVQGWSSIDTANIEKMNNENWLLSIVHTPQGWLIRLDTYKPFRITIDNLELVVIQDRDKTLDDTIVAEIKSKVTRKGNTYNWKNGAGGTQMSYGHPADGAEYKKNGRGGVPNTSSPSELAKHDDYFASLADREWEARYGWEEYTRKATVKSKNNPTEARQSGFNDTEVA